MLGARGTLAGHELVHTVIADFYFAKNKTGDLKYFNSTEKKKRTKKKTGEAHLPEVKYVKSYDTKNCQTKLPSTYIHDGHSSSYVITKKKPNVKKSAKMSIHN